MTERTLEQIMADEQPERLLTLEEIMTGKPARPDGDDAGRETGDQLDGGE